MKITLKHLFTKNVTNQYPEKFHPIQSGQMPDNSRNQLNLIPELCNGCNSCVRACPVNCITVETIKVVPGDDVPPMLDGKKRGLWVSRYDIDMAKCCFCSLCTEACPTEAVIMTKEFEYSSDSRDDLYFKFADMSPEMIAEKNEFAAKFKKEQAAKKAAASKAKEEAAAKKEATSTEEVASEEKKEDNV